MDDAKMAIRWKQRFAHYKKAYALLEQTIAIEDPSDAEMTFDLAGKVLKDFLEEEGFRVMSPRDTVKQAFQSGLIADGHTWLEALQDRNLTVHTYEEAMSISLCSVCSPLAMLPKIPIFDTPYFQIG
jgi:nucleotidyltransferase substrate binding protein (TIGR01987 family)